MNNDRLTSPFGPLVRRATATIMESRRSQFAALPPTPGRVVFLGDSITEWGLWDEWFPDLPTANRGIASNTIADVLARLDSSIHEPRAICLLIGTNDLSGTRRSASVGDIAARMLDLVLALRRRAPTAPLIVNSVMPRSATFAERIGRLNDHYRRITAQVGGVYVDLWPALADTNGALRRTCTLDGLHLTGDGYQAWVDVLRPHLAAFAT